MSALDDKPHGLTAAEVQAAERFGMKTGEYAAMKGVRNFADWQEARRDEANRVAAEEAALRAIAAEDALKRLKRGGGA